MRICCSSFFRSAGLGRLVGLGISVGLLGWEMIERSDGSAEQMQRARDQHIQLYVLRMTLPHGAESIQHSGKDTTSIRFAPLRGQLLPGIGNQLGAFQLRVGYAKQGRLIEIHMIGTGHVGHKADHVEIAALEQHLEQIPRIRVTGAIKQQDLRILLAASKR